MKKTIVFILSTIVVLLTACGYDNFDEPKSKLVGKVTYNGTPVGVRATGIELELWQDGFETKSHIPVYVAHDGSFSAALFNGQYKLVRKAGAPWEAQLKDTIIVNVKKNTEIEVPVTPYFTFGNERFQASSGNITATFTINKIVEKASVSSVKLYLGKSILTDENRKEADMEASAADIKIGQPMTITAKIPASLVKNGYLFVRVGVKATVSNEYYYTQVQKIDM